MSSWKNPGGEGVGVPAQTKPPQPQGPGIPRKPEQKEHWRNHTGNSEKGLRANSLGHSPSASSLTWSQEEMFP